MRTLVGVLSSQADEKVSVKEELSNAIANLETPCEVTVQKNFVSSRTYCNEVWLSCRVICLY